ncbi:MAG TPA: electron transport complex subunit RsxG [Gammaproteobacteria bacterium]
MDTPKGSVAKTLLLVGLIAAAAAALVAGSYELSYERIAANEREALLRSLYSVLDPALRDRGLTTTQLTATDPALLGSKEPTDVFVVATESGDPEAVIFASTAPDGYNAPIRLLVGVSPDGVVTGVRVLSHRETPGLGDAIELRKSDWILQFDGKRLGDPPEALWAVDKDGGAFDALTGATVTPRAIVRAVRNTLLYFERHRDELFGAARSAAGEGRD